jgi:hypothetical protein
MQAMPRRVRKLPTQSHWYDHWVSGDARHVMYAGSLRSRYTVPTTRAVRGRIWGLSSRWDWYHTRVSINTSQCVDMMSRWSYYTVSIRPTSSWRVYRDALEHLKVDCIL